MWGYGEAMESVGGRVGGEKAGREKIDCYFGCCCYYITTKKIE